MLGVTSWTFLLNKYDTFANMKGKYLPTPTASQKCKNVAATKQTTKSTYISIN